MGIFDRQRLPRYKSGGNRWHKPDLSVYEVTRSSDSRGTTTASTLLEIQKFVPSQPKSASSLVRIIHSASKRQPRLIGHPVPGRWLSEFRAVLHVWLRDGHWRVTLFHQRETLASWAFQLQSGAFCWYANGKSFVLFCLWDADFDRGKGGADIFLLGFTAGLLN